MKRVAAVLIAILLSGCASAPPPAQPQLFRDQLFDPPAAGIGPEQIFALTPEMKQYARALTRSDEHHQIQRTLFDALYKKDQLKIDYDSTMTRNAAETFAARRGNCLSLLIMTAALANEMNMVVQYQSVSTQETWSRSGRLYFASGHVNLVLGKPRKNDMRSYDSSELMVIDFEPPEETKNLVVEPISEKRVIAMYMNNRAAEALVSAQLNDAYWWARKAIEADPVFFGSYNTLAIVYQHHGNLPEAEAVLRYAQLLQPNSTIAMSNMLHLLEDMGRTQEADALRVRLAQLEPNPPFHYFNLGQKAMQEGDYRKARKLFAQEVERAPYYHEFHFWLAVASFKLGDMETADKHMKLAMENSTTYGEHDLYAAKLDRLRSYERKHTPSVN
jgi:tetratricopeptide (TPR) repeat protein